MLKQVCRWVYLLKKWQIKKAIPVSSRDQYAIGSLNKAVAAIQGGFFKDEIVPVTVSSRKGDVVVDQDEQPLNAKVDKIPTLRPAFKKTVRLPRQIRVLFRMVLRHWLVTSSEVADARGLKPLAKVVAYASNSQHPSRVHHCPCRCH